MKVLLITTPPNKVDAALKAIPDVELCVLNILTTEHKRDAIIRIIENENPDLLITYRCPYILPSEIISAFPAGAFNVHPSLLPSHKGLNPWQEIFESHETTSGVTIHRITAEIDGGPIIMQKSFDISPDDTIASARENADRIAAGLVKAFVSGYT